VVLLVAVCLVAVSDLLSPERFLTKICMVSSGSAEEAREETLEMLLERMVVLRASGGGGCKAVAVMSRERCSYPIKGESVDGDVVAVEVLALRSGSSWA
jgi:hypothetical protein